MDQKKFLVFLGILLAVVALTSACAPSTLPPGGTWTPNQGCTKGGAYQNGNTRCHCWGHCGYICQSNSTGSTSTTSATTKKTSATTKKPSSTTRRSSTTQKSSTGTTKKQSPCPFGGVWYNPKGQRCHCQSANHTAYYVCADATTSPASG